MNWILIVAAFFVHLVFFYSIFDIYFTSPLVHGMNPRIIPLSPPAKRLVLFVADGLRADKLYSISESGVSHSPFLRNVIEKTGAWGVSHTRVPTESRPGHVALIAGFYEDVSAVAKGWKENPVEFDSVFNESRYTWSWGSPDILPMFAKGASGDHVFTKMYPAESEDFAGADASKLDTWVFDSVSDFLTHAKANATVYKMLHEDKIVLFLHLLGIDTNGHSHKPYSQEYLSNIEIVDEGVKQMVNMIEEFYDNDGKTSYILSSDHGMTDWGSHGAGDLSETLTPLIAWGAGIRKPQEKLVHESDSPQDWKLNHIRRSDVLQADISPLMASLIGIPFPMNSVGTIPLDMLNNSDQYKAEALFTNALQLLEQFDIKMKQKKDTTLSLLFVPFRNLDEDTRNELVATIRQYISESKYDYAISKTRELINLSLSGLNYYHNYDRFFLGTSIVFGFLGWISYVVVLILQKHTLLTLPAGPDRLVNNTHGSPFWQSAKGIRILFTLLAVIISSLLYAQSLPLTHYIYTLLPVFLWHKVIQQRSCVWIVWWYIRDHGYILYSVSYMVLGLAGLEIIVLTFFSRKLLSVGIAVLSVWPFISNTTKENKLYLWGWCISCLLLAIFPLLPPVGRDANYIFVIMAGIIGILILLMSRKKYYQKQATVSYVQTGILGLSIYFVWTTSLSISQKEGLPYINQLGAWTILCSSAVMPLVVPTTMYTRLLTIALAFFPTYLLLSTSHEGFFVLMLCTLLFFWLQLEAISAYKKFEKLEELEFGRSLGILESHRKLRLPDLRIAYFFIFLLMTAFYGTGNIASVNSFDPSTVYCFLTVFNPFVMGALLLLKIIIPFVLVSCTFNAIHIVLNVPTQSLFLLVMLMSDYMALHFFFLVCDEGSWLDIGTSISHYVMVMCLNLFVIVLLALSHIFTNCTIFTNYKKHLM